MFFRSIQRVSGIFAFKFVRCCLMQNTALCRYFTKSSGTVRLTFEWPKDGVQKTVSANVGDSLLDVVLDNELDIDGFGACEGELACSTCHLILSDEIYNALPNPPSDEELDLLDTAPLITDTSRLGCQVIVSEEMDGAVIKVPDYVFDTRV